MNKANCNNCDNFKPHADRIWYGDKCQNYKSKQHPLDELFTRIKDEIKVSHDDNSIKWFYVSHLVERLRYESIKYGTDLVGEHGTYNADEGLKREGKDDWIPK